MHKIAIVGYGRFGELLARLAQDTFDVAIVENDEQRQQQARADGYTVIPLELLSRADFIFLAVPISAIEAMIQAIVPFVGQSQIVIDVCSVKVYPAKLMREYLTNCQLLASHPMFGPDSAQNGVKDLQVALCPLTIEPDNLKIIEDFWNKLGCEVVKTTPEEHDRDVLYSQAFTYTIAKIIINSQIPDITFQTKSFQNLNQVARLSANDTDQLFHDVLFYNPYFPEMKAKLAAAIAQTTDTLDTIEKE